ncbi:DUF6538 domain-containing protein [Pseudomonas sp. Z1-12]|uniref:DUF6538 domain-containing protein n=1 Tax=Pseudomonas sp. Z1-12 TaxID=2817408 RepID=UPI003DA7DE9B
MLSLHSVYYFRIVVPDVIRPLFPQRQIRRSLQTRCKREALIRGRDLLAQVQCLFPQVFQGIRPSLELVRGAGRREVVTLPVGFMVASAATNRYYHALP